MHSAVPSTSASPAPRTTRHPSRHAATSSGQAQYSLTMADAAKPKPRAAGQASAAPHSAHSTGSTLATWKASCEPGTAATTAAATTIPAGVTRPVASFAREAAYTASPAYSTTYQIRPKVSSGSPAKGTSTPIKKGGYG